MTANPGDPAYDFVDGEVGHGPSNSDRSRHSHRRPRTTQGSRVTKRSGILRSSHSQLAASAPASPSPSSGGPQEPQEAVDPRNLAQDHIIPCLRALPPNLYPKKVWCAVFATPPPRLSSGIFHIPGVRYARQDELWRVHQATSFPLNTLSSWRERGAIVDNSEGTLYFVLNLLTEDAIDLIANNHPDAHCRSVIWVWLNRVQGWIHAHKYPMDLLERLWEKKYYWCHDILIQS